MASAVLLKTLGGRALQRTAPAAPQRVSKAAAELRRRFTTSGATESEEAALMKLRERKRELTEELYDVMAQTEKKRLRESWNELGVLFGDSDTRQLLGTLTKQIKPRMHDPQWRSFRKQQWVVDGLAAMSALGFACYAFKTLMTPSHKKKEPDHMSLFPASLQQKK